LIRYLKRNWQYLKPSRWRTALEILHRKYDRSGAFVTAKEMPGCSLFPEETLRLTIARFQPHSVLDVGCGTGQSLAYFLENGIDAWGVEGSRMARRRSKYPRRIIRGDLRRPLSLKRKFDLVWCYEVAEHIDPVFADTFVESLTAHAPVVVISAAPPGQGGEGHVNEQPQSYWIDKAANNGFNLDLAATAELQATQELYSANAMVFVRSQPETNG
jgi:SAM-dependent methyltransferase